MESIGVLSESNTKFVLDQARLFAKDRGLNAPDELERERRPVYFHNTSGFEIPAYGVLQVRTVRDDLTCYHDVKRPFDYDACQTTILFNGPYAVPDGERGTAQSGPVYRVIHDGGTYSVGDRMGWKASSFQVGLGSLLVNLGSDEVSTNCLRVAFDYSTMPGQTTSSIPAGGSGTFNRRKKTSTGFTADTSRSYTAWNDSDQDIATNKRILAFPGEGVWLAVEVC